MATSDQTKDKMEASLAVKLTANEKYEEELLSQSQSVQEDPPRLSTRKTGNSSIALDHFRKISLSNLAESTAEEEEKIQTMMEQSASFYVTDKLMESQLKPSYICYRSFQSGHFIKDCPKKKKSQTVKKTTGIPQTFLKEIDDPNMPGAMLSNTGRYVIPIINAEAYAVKRKEKPQCLSKEPSSSPEEREQISDMSLCLLCKDIMTDAAIVPCCANSFCDDCIRTTLLESKEHECPVCHQKGVSPDSIVANKLLRQYIENFDNKSQQQTDLVLLTTPQRKILPMAPQVKPPGPAPKLEEASRSPTMSTSDPEFIRSEVHTYLRKIRTKERDYYSRSRSRCHSPGYPQGVGRRDGCPRRNVFLQGWVRHDLNPKGRGGAV